MNKLTLIIAALSLAACAKKGMSPAVRSEIETKLQATQTPIQECYQRQLTVNRKLQGMIVAQAAIQPDGSFSEITLRRDEPADPVLKFCIVQEHRGVPRGTESAGNRGASQPCDRPVIDR